MYYEKAQFKRRVKRNKVKLKDGNTKESITEAINITGISKKANFKDNETIAVIKIEDLNKIIELENQLKTKDDKIKQLETEVNKDINSFKANEIEQYTKIIFDLVQLINNRNQEVIKASETINNNILAIVKTVVNEYEQEIKETNQLNNNRVLELLNKLEENYNKELATINGRLVKDYLKEVENINQYNKVIANDIERQVTEANQQLQQASLFKLLRDRKKINFNIATDKIKEEVKLADNIVNCDIVKVSDYDIFNIIDKLLIPPNPKIEVLKIKDKFNIDLEKLLINLDLELLPDVPKNFIEVGNITDKK